VKPYFYVLNNLLRAAIDPKIGDATTVQNHAPTILVCFGLGKRFSVTDLMWRHIQEVSLTSSQSFPYAPYLMYIIEQVTGFGFHHDVTHPDWNVKRLQAKASKGKEPATDVGGSEPEQAADDEPHVPSMDPPPNASGGRGKATRHALQRFMSYFCYCQAKLPLSTMAMMMTMQMMSSSLVFSRAPNLFGTCCQRGSVRTHEAP